MTLRLGQLNLEHKNKEDICFTNTSFVIQLCQPQEQKNLCFDSRDEALVGTLMIYLPYNTSQTLLLKYIALPSFALDLSLVDF